MFLDAEQHIYFDDDSHSYFSKIDGKKLISASTIIGKYSNPFDPDGTILKRCAAKEGVSPEELQKRWTKLGDDSRVKGHSIHSSFEEYIKSGKISDDEHKDIIQDFQKRIKLKGDLYTEVTLYDLNYGIAGRTDLVEVWWDNIVNIYDFKTNKKINTYSFGKRMLPPLSHLFDSTYIHYECQLSLYSLMLEARGFCPKNLTLLWINPKTRQIEPISVKYRRQEMIDMLSHYNANKNEGKKRNV